MHQTVAGSGGNTIDLTLLSTEINEEYIKVLIPLKYSTKWFKTTSNSWENPIMYETHTGIIAANQ